MTTSAYGTGLATIAADGTVLDTWYPAPTLDSPAAEKPDFAELVGEDKARGVTLVQVETVIEDLSAAPVDTHDVYLRLHLLSSRLVQPHGLSLEQ